MVKVRSFFSIKFSFMFFFETQKWHCRRMCARLPLQELQNYNSLFNNCWQENVGTHQKKETTWQRAKEKPQQDGRRDEMVFRIKPHTHQRCLEGSNKPCAHQDPETPQRPSQNCVRVSPAEVQVSSGLPQERGSGCSECGVRPLGGGTR